MEITLKNCKAILIAVCYFYVFLVTYWSTHCNCLYLAQFWILLLTLFHKNSKVTWP